MWGGSFCQPCPAGFGRRDFPRSVRCSWFSRTPAGAPRSTLPGHGQTPFSCFCLHLGMRKFLDWLQFYQRLFRDLSLGVRRGSAGDGIEVLPQRGLDLWGGEVVCLSPPGAPRGATPEILWRAIANAEYSCCSFGSGLVTVVWLRGLPKVELLEPWKVGGLGDLCVGESALLATSCHHQKCGSVGVPSAHHGEEFAGKFFPAGFRPFPMGRSAQSHWA